MVIVNWNKLGLVFITTTTAATQTTHQVHFNQNTQSTTLIDLLANSPHHSKLLHLIQISRLVPSINLLNSSTLFAPTNKAIENSPKLHTYLKFNQLSLQDNLHTQLRQTILYHLLNTSLPESIPSQSPLLIDSLLFPTAPTDHDTQIDAQEQTTTGLLGHHTQKLRIITRDAHQFIGVDEAGKGGIQLPPSEQFKNGSNSVLIPIHSILDPPRSLKHLIRSTASISTYASILSDEFLDQLDQIPHLTVFAPHNDAWNEIGSVELAYLRSNFSNPDSLKLFRQATADNVLDFEGVGYSDLLRSELEGRQDVDLLLPSLDGKFLAVGISPNSSKLTLNGSEILRHDILASNGVLHIIPKVLISSTDNPLEMNAEKYLLALNCTKFVRFFQQANLTSTYLTNRTSDKSYTILAVRDDVIRLKPLNEEQSGIQAHSKGSANDRWKKLSTKEPDSLKSSLKYHVIEGKYLIDDLKDGILLRTELDLGSSSTSSSKSKQRMLVSVSNSDRKSGSSSSKQSNSPIIGFGGANVVGGDPVQVGNTVIYIISQIIEPPADLLQVALSDIRFSTGVASIFSAKLDHQLKSISGLTYLMPTNKAFSDLGLIMDYLLLERSKSDLVQVLKFHALTEVIYLNEIKIGTDQRYPTLEGTELYINKLEHHNVTIHSPTVGGVALNGESRDSEVINSRDILIENGSMEFINQVELPSGVEIGIRKLMLGAKASTMLELMESSELSWILDSGRPTGNASESAALQRRTRSSIELVRAFTILCPSDEAFTKLNLTYYLEDRGRLNGLVRQHIIPTYPSQRGLGDAAGEAGLGRAPAPFQPLYVADGIVYPTLLSKAEGGGSGYGDVSFRGGADGWLVGIKDARGPAGAHDAARVTNFGRASPRLVPAAADALSFNGGILLLDLVLEPYVPSFWQAVGKFILLAILAALLAALLATAAWTLAARYRHRPPPVGYQIVEPMEE